MVASAISAGLNIYNTVFSLLSRSNRKTKISEGAITKIRSQEEEEYKSRITPTLAHFLSQLVEKNDQMAENGSFSTSFDADSAPEISIDQYFERIVKYTPCSKECYYVACIFIDRIVQNNNFMVTSFNVHRLLITSIMIAAKLLDDHTYNNRYYSHVAGIEVHELNELECKFLHLLNYDLSVPADIYDCYRLETEKQSSYDIMEPLGSQDSDEDEYPNRQRPTAHQPLVMMEKKLRRSRSMSIDQNNPCVHRRQRSSSFNIELEFPLVFA